MFHPAILAETKMKRVRLWGKQPADGLWRDDSKSSGTMTLQKMWPRPCVGALALPFLDVIDCCHLEGASKFWREHTLGEKGWQARFLDRFGVNPCSLPGSSAFSGLISQKRQKLMYFLFLSLRILSGLEVFALAKTSPSYGRSLALVEKPSEIAFKTMASQLGHK